MGSSASILDNTGTDCSDDQEKILLDIYSSLGDTLHSGEDASLTTNDVLQFLSASIAEKTIAGEDDPAFNILLTRLDDLHTQISTSISQLGKVETVPFPTFRLWIIQQLHSDEVSLRILHSITKEICTQIQQKKREAEASRLRSRLEGPPKYPMYVMQVNELLDQLHNNLGRESTDGFDGLLKHEDAMLQGRLYEVVERPGWPGQYFVYHTLSNGLRGEAIKWPVIEDVVYETEEKIFHRARFLSISHQWLRPSRDPMIAHPDSSDRIKCKALVHYLSLPKSQDAYDFIWMDYFSIPQLPSRRDLQCLAISSLPTYFIYSTCTLILCKDMESFQRETLGYLSRGHCLMELLTSKLPRIDVFNKWYVPGIAKDGSWGHTTVYSMIDQQMKVLMWQEFVDSGSPLQGNFTVEEDRFLMKPLIEEYIKAFRRFEDDFLHRIREAETWKEVQDLPDELKPQLLGIPLRKIKSSIYPVSQTYPEFQKPADLANFMLPKNYVDMLENSLQLIS